MRVKQLAELLEIIVRKVVREEMKGLLKEIRNTSKPIIKETRITKVTEPFDPLDVSGVLGMEQSITQTPKIQFSKNSMLSEVLNETAESGEWRTMNSTFEANNAQGFFDRQSMMSLIPDTDIEGKPVNIEVLKRSGVVNALTKDYSALMKAINTKKGK
jgi:hypothetical protein